MLRVGLVGIGVMGRGHLDMYLRLMNEGYPVKLVAVCDVDDRKFHNEFIPGNVKVGLGAYDFSQFNCYHDLDEMLKNERLDYLDVALPTYLHCWAALKGFEAGLHVLCEKPMALNIDQCDQMIAAAEKAGKTLMIAQCLRFWPAYEELKRTIEDKRYGAVTSGYFWRGGETPMWSFENWLLKKDKAGGALLDQHIHDVDMINWLFGVPQGVSCVAKTAIEGSINDAVSTNYFYEDKAVNAQDDWTLNGDYGFTMTFRVSFERGSLVWEGKLMAYPHDAPGFEVELPADDGYYREIKYFTQALINGTPIETAAPFSTRETIRIAEAEAESAAKFGQPVML